MSGNSTIPGPHGSTLGLTVSGGAASAIVAAFAAELAGFAKAGTLSIEKVTSPAAVTAPGTAHGLLIIKDDTAPGATFFVPKGFDFVMNESTVPITIVTDPTSSTQIITPSSFTGDAPPAATTVFGAAGGGSDVSENGNNLFQALATGGGQYFIAFGSGNDTVWSTSGNNVISAGAGANLIGLGTGGNFVSSTGNDTILAGSGLGVVVAGAGSNAVLFGSNGQLAFIGGTATSSTVIGGTGNETSFGGTGATGLFLTGTGAFVLDAQGANDTVIAGAGNPSVALFAESGGSVTLFSNTDGNVFIAGSGNETLNAGGTTGGNTLWAGTGAASLVGGSGANVFAVAHGGAGGADTIGNWTSKDTLALLGYANSGGFTQSTVNGNATISLSDGTKITIQGISSIPTSHIFLS